MQQVFIWSQIPLFGPVNRPLSSVIGHNSFSINAYLSQPAIDGNRLAK
jgi:hypothetical protein